MFIYALISSALHFAIQKEEKLMEELREVIHQKEPTVLQEEEMEKEPEKKANMISYPCNA